MIILIKASWLAEWDVVAVLVDPPEALMLARVNLSLSQLAIVALDHKELIISPFSVFVLVLFPFMSLQDRGSNPLLISSVIIGLYEWLGQAFLIPNADCKGAKPSVTCLAFGVILNRFRSDGIMTVASVMIITVLGVRWV